jgi:hypothetical protein
MGVERDDRYLAKAEEAWLLAVLIGVAFWNRGRALARIWEANRHVESACGL